MMLSDIDRVVLTNPVQNKFLKQMNKYASIGIYPSEKQFQFIEHIYWNVKRRIRAGRLKPLNSDKTATNAQA